MKINKLNITQLEIEIDFKIAVSNDFYILSEILESLVSSHFCQDSFFDPEEVRDNLLIVSKNAKTTIKNAEFIIIMTLEEGFRSEKYYAKSKVIKNS